MISLRRKRLSILIGNGLDHFDTALYGFLAPLLAPLFFPQYDPVVQLILGYGFLATSLITRPVGCFLFGLMAYKQGPMKALSFSLMGVSLTTVLMGCLPTYDQGGWISPVALLGVRMLGGIFSAGESTIAKLYLLEEGETREKFKLSYWYETSSMMGIMVASLIATFCITSAFFLSWRECFWLGGLTGIIGYSLRAFGKKTKESFSIKSLPFSISSIGHYKKEGIRIAVCGAFSYMTYSVPFLFMNSFIPLITSFSMAQMMEMNSWLLLLDMVMIPSLGKFLKKYDPRFLMILSSSLLSLSMIPLFLGLAQGSLLYIILARGWIILWGVVFLCPLNVWIKSLIPGPSQYMVVGLWETLGASTIGRLTPSFCLSLWHLTGSVKAPALFLAGFMGLTGWILWSTK